MKPKIALGLTTYKDIRASDFGARTYDVLQAASPHLVPTELKLINDRYLVANAADFASHWHEDRKLQAWPKYGVALPPTWAEIGPNWKMRSPVSGEAALQYPTDANGAAAFTLRCNFAKRIDWQTLFLKLIELFQPSHAMLHLFTAAEIDAAGDGRFAFRDAFAGEPHFTMWRSSTGDWRKPDLWEFDARRQYRFLPELAWANYLGSEFDGRYDGKLVAERAAKTVRGPCGLFFQLTAGIEDIMVDPARFDAARVQLRQAFAADFFRTGAEA